MTGFQLLSWNQKHNSKLSDYFENVTFLKLCGWLCISFDRYVTAVVLVTGQGHQGEGRIHQEGSHILRGGHHHQGDKQEAGLYQTLYLHAW